ncbi:glutamate racemase [Blochmannia endosymbiont of Camponotus sp.]|uniref:glutamate racemase n=1 Tax=Blochmannia endosymbiont of Camponotus sp. TaxID=700220 RepID=UPI00202583EE|nr:glutamate racemase [Blochmannia endosymbiont of Camponotus sp.]URJ29825.1 glutamate racemase [Blochmannia endosymbiont of Camponotus sp.]
MTYFCKNIYKYKQPTILILDSGVGGLSIYTAIRKLLPHVWYLYFFDNQAFPYGERSEIFITNRVTSIIKAVQNQHRLDLVIIACNTASVVSLKILQNHFLFPIIGVIPAIKLASKLTKNGIIGVLATHRTVNHDYTCNLIKRFANKYKVLLLGTSELVNLAESKIYGEKISLSMLRSILAPWLELKQPPDTIVLGCTHFSLLKKELITTLSSNSYLVDSRRTIAKYSLRLLRHNKTLTKGAINNINYSVRLNKIYCSMDTIEAIKLKSILLSNYNFFSSEILSI